MATYPCRLCDLHTLDIRRPESIQRSLDEDRVEEILQYYRHRLSQGQGIIVPGVLIVARADVSEPLWLIDGQHRWSALTRIANESPNDIVYIQEFRLGTDAVSLGELFRLVNTSVPVPDHLIHGSVSESYNDLLTKFGDLFTKRYKPFLVRTSQPRRPNINLDHLKNVLFRNRSTVLDAFPSAELLFGFVNWVNQKILELYVDVELKDKALSKSSEWPLVLSYDIDYSWVEKQGPGWMHAFRCNQEPPEIQSAYVTRGKRSAIPRAVRNALWRRDFGERAGVGECFVCSNEIKQMDFDVGHIQSVAQGGTDDLSNLLPICRRCNLDMGVCNLYEFKEKYY